MVDGHEIASEVAFETNTPWLDFVVTAAESIPSAVIGSAIGAGLAMWFTINLNRQEQRRRLTQQFIDEMLSPSFLKHRIALGVLLEEFNAKPNLIGRFAQGFWYPGGDNEYVGDEYAELNLHQHFEASIGWVRRLVHALRRGRVDEGDIKAALSDAYEWMDVVLHPVAREVSKQIEEASKNGIEVGATSWVGDVYKLSDFFGFRRQ